VIFTFDVFVSELHAKLRKTDYIEASFEFLVVAHTYMSYLSTTTCSHMYKTSLKKVNCSR